MTMLHIEIHPDKSALVDRSLSLVTERIQQAIAAQGTCSIALAGGSTPKPLYEALAKTALPWEQLQVFWSDERYVPVDHPDSNAGMAKAAWLDRVPIPAANVHITPTHFPDPGEAAIAYEQTLYQVLGTDQPMVNIVLLGMGDDGHTASLFPRTGALLVSDRLVTVGEKGDDARITFTAEFINRSQCVMFLVAGRSKQLALAEIFSADAEDIAFPARMIRPQGELWWLLDAAAGKPVQNRPETHIF